MRDEEIKAMNVHQRIWCVKRELCEMGISKDQFQKHQKYNYRGVDDVLGAVSALHCKYRLDFAWVAIENLQVKEVGPKIHMTGMNVYRIINIDTGEYSEFVAPGEGMDNGDKSSGKFSSYGYKNALFFKYEIPVKGQNIDEYDPRLDVENDSHMDTPVTGGPPNPEQKERIENMKRQGGDVAALYDRCLENQKDAVAKGGLTKEGLVSYGNDLEKLRDAMNADSKAKKPKISDADWDKYSQLVKTSQGTIDAWFSQEHVGRDPEPKTAKDKALNMIGDAKNKSREDSGDKSPPSISDGNDHYSGMEDPYTSG